MLAGSRVMNAPSESPMPDPVPEKGRTSLVVLVAVGTVAVSLVGGALFIWLAWLLSHQPAPLRGDSGWWDWLSRVGGDALFDAARTTATILAVIGVGGAALVAYRRQDTAERSHLVSIEGQKTAAKQYTLDSKKYELDRDRHQLETERRTDDRVRDLRARFTTIAEQLGSENYSVRHAGAYALGSLADDWHAIGNDAERQVCVHLLCAQLRSPRPQLQLPDDGRVEYSESDTEVRKAIVEILRLHRCPATDAVNDWRSCSLDLSGADLSGFIFNEMYLETSNLDGSNLSFAQFVGADLAQAMMARATLNGTNFLEADLTSAKLYSALTEKRTESDHWANRAIFERAILRKALFTSAYMPNANFEEADLTGAVLNSAKLEEASFEGAILSDAHCIDAKFSKADFRNADLRRANFVRADTIDADFTDARYDAATVWRHGKIPEGVRLAEDEEA